MLTLLGGGTLALAGCGVPRRLNPLGLFGRSEEVQIERVETDQNEALRTDPRPLVAEVTELTTAGTAGGVIVEARGLPARQGFYGVDLFPENNGEPIEGALVYSFRVIDAGSARQGPPQSRELVAATFIPDIRIAEIREIRVVGQRNTRVIRR